MRLSSHCARIRLKPAGFNVMPCSALQLWVRCCCYIACSILFGSLPIYLCIFLKAFSPSFSLTNTKHKSGTPPDITKLDFFSEHLQEAKEQLYLLLHHSSSHLQSPVLSQQVLLIWRGKKEHAAVIPALGTGESRV